MIEIAVKHRIRFVQEIDVPTIVLVVCCHLVHLVQRLDWQDGRQFLHQRIQLLRIAQPPNHHPAKIGSANENYDSQFLRQEPTRTAQVTPAHEETSQHVRGRMHDLIVTISKVVDDDTDCVSFGLFLALEKCVNFFYVVPRFVRVY